MRADSEQPRYRSQSHRGSRLAVRRGRCRHRVGHRPLTAGLFRDKAYAALSRRVGSAAELVRGGTLAAGNDQQDSNRKVSIEDGTASFLSLATCEVVMCGLAAVVSIRDVPAVVRRGWRAADSRGCPSGAGLGRERGAPLLLDPRQCTTTTASSTRWPRSGTSLPIWPRTYQRLY